jgi:hypothetical protein
METTKLYGEQVAKMLGVSSGHLCNLNDFPNSIADPTDRRRRLWDRAEVIEWARLSGHFILPAAFQERRSPVQRAHDEAHELADWSTVAELRPIAQMVANVLNDRGTIHPDRRRLRAYLVRLTRDGQLAADPTFQKAFCEALLDEWNQVWELVRLWDATQRALGLI